MIGIENKFDFMPIIVTNSYDIWIVHALVNLFLINSEFINIC